MNKTIVDLWIEWAQLAVEAVEKGIGKATVERHVPSTRSREVGITRCMDNLWLLIKEAETNES